MTAEPQHHHPHAHGHDHRHPPHPKQPDLEDQPFDHYQLMAEAIGELLIEKGVFGAADLRRTLEAIDARSPADGAKLVARAWVDPGFKARLLEDVNAAALEFGIDAGAIPIRALENTARLHNVVVCTLCSCYPRGLLGLPPDWYKARAYRSRAIREPRAVLAEFGTGIADGRRDPGARQHRRPALPGAADAARGHRRSRRGRARGAGHPRLHDRHGRAGGAAAVTLRSGDDYRESLRDGRAVWIEGERVADVPSHPAFKPIVDARARIYDLAHEPALEDVLTYPDADVRRAPAGRASAAADPGRLAGQARRGRGDPRRSGRRGHPGRRRDGRRALVALRRPGRAERGRPALRRQHPPPRRAGRAGGRVPRLGQHRPQGRSLQAAAGAGPGHAAAHGPRDRCRDRGARRQVRDRGGLRPSGVRQADDRQLGRCRAVRLCGRVRGADERPGPEAHLPRGVRRQAPGGGLSDRQPLRRGRHAVGVRRRADPLGGRAVLPAHPGGDLHPLLSAPLQRVCRSCSGSSGWPS